MDLVVGISKGCLAQQNSEVAMAREGNQQREQHLQNTPLNSPSILLLLQMVRLSWRTQHLP